MILNNDIETTKKKRSKSTQINMILNNDIETTKK